jgi:hypothetical protein
MEEPTFMLPEVWLRVTGIPSDVRNDYIALWALGSLFGKTMEVDMTFTRKTEVLRLLSWLSTQMDMLIAK